MKKYFIDYFDFYDSRKSEFYKCFRLTDSHSNALFVNRSLEAIFSFCFCHDILYSDVEFGFVFKVKK